MDICSLLLFLFGDLKNTSMPGGMGGRHGKQSIVSVFVVFSCLFVMPGDQEVGKKVRVLQRSEVNSGSFHLFKSTKNEAMLFSWKGTDNEAASGPDSFGDSMTVIALLLVLCGQLYLELFCILSQQTFSVQSQIGSISGFVSQETKIKDSMYGNL